MRVLTTLVAAATVAALSGCVVAPARGYYQERAPFRGYYQDRDHSYDRNHQGRDGYYYRQGRDGRWRDGDHAGGTNTPD